MTMIESLSGRVGVGDVDRDSAVVADLITAVDHWGLEVITEAFGTLMYTMINLTQPDSDEDSALSLVVPAVLTRLQEMQLPEVPDEALPTVAGLLTAACLGQSPYEWRTNVGPLGVQEPITWCFVAWLLNDFVDNAVLEQPGGFARLLTEVLRQGPAT